MTPDTHDINVSLLERFRAGDEQAFARIFNIYHQRLFYFAARFVEEAEAKDVASEAFATLWQERAAIRSEEGIVSLLFVAARNRCLNLIKRRIRHEQKHTELLHQLDATEVPDLALEQIHTDLVAILLQQVDRLPERMREVFLLSFEEGLKPGAIAERLGLSVQTVRNQKLSAIKLLQAAIGSQQLLLAITLLETSQKIFVSR